MLIALVDKCADGNLYSWRRDTLNIRGYVWNGFAAQIRSVREYFDRSMQLLDPNVRSDLFCPSRPIRAESADKSSAYIEPEGHCVNSLVADGGNIEGDVENSILFPGVVVEAGATVRNCVLFRETKVCRDAQIAYVIADKNVRILPGHPIIGQDSDPLVIRKGCVIS